MSVDVHIVEENNKKYAVLHHRYYDVKEEHRGKKPKIWLVMNDSDVSSVPIGLRHILCKLGRTNLSCDNWGEIFACNIAKQMGVNAVDYYLVDYEDNGEKHNGVMCGSYFVNEDQYEMSVKDLQTVYTDLQINYETLETDKPINTVYSILKDLEEIIDFPEPRKTKVLQSLKKQLLEQCLFDYLLGQSDRHWLNTTFLVYEKGGEVYITKAACYDNGNIAFLQRKFVSLQGISREIGKDPIHSPLLQSKMDSYIPVMGVKTATAKLEPTSDGQIGSKMRADKSKKDVFIDELTDEILHNPDLANLFAKFKYEFSMDKVLKDIERGGDNPPPEIVKLVNDVITYQINSLDVVLDAKLQKIHEEEGRRM